MPTYEYLCQACSHRFETWQKMTEEPLTSCPECGGHIRRVLYAAGIVFKGSGFYKTDHSNSPLPPSNGSNGETKKGEEKSSETKTSESKPSENGTGQNSKTTNDSKSSTAAATS